MATPDKKLALISVSDKAHITDMAKFLVQLNFEILSTGGTAKTLREAGIPVTQVSDHTGFPEIMDGRVKTLHPKIHGGLLGMRDLPSHAEQAAKNNIRWIDLVIVNLYPFEQTVAKPNVKIEEAIENIDIGGPSMIRSAAKNHKFVTVLTDPADYRRVLEEFNVRGETSLKTRQELAAKAFALTARYDAAIDAYLSRNLTHKNVLHLAYEDGETLRYGENAHQSAVFYKSHDTETSIAIAKKLHGKELSFNNIVDADAALECAREFAGQKAVVVVKHTNPCGIAVGDTLDEAFEMAWKGDPVSAFGSVIACTDTVDGRTARRLAGRFVEILVAPDFTPEALEFLKDKSHDIRILKTGPLDAQMRPKKVYRPVIGGILEQDRDAIVFEKLDTVTKAAFPKNKLELAKFAYAACKHIKSNTIALAHEYKPGLFMLLGMGAGQPNRVDSLRKLCATKAEENLLLFHKEQAATEPFADYKQRIFGECVMASDAFFPFDDTVREAAKFGIKYIIQPGGSKRDADVIKACDELGIAMCLTHTRHFKH
ncbi:MAG: bifunctional phosphoribosylaminoimidazolecarboxamide formyltransferase/IMP cyclohydrolase [Fibrobacterota bacterium]